MNKTTMWVFTEFTHSYYQHIMKTLCQTF